MPMASSSSVRQPAGLAVPAAPSPRGAAGPAAAYFVTSSSPPASAPRGCTARVKKFVFPMPQDEKGSSSAPHCRRSMTNDAEYDADRVHIPETIEESDSESDSFGEKLRKLNEEDDKGQTSKKNGNQQIWMMNMEMTNQMTYPEKQSDWTSKVQELEIVSDGKDIQKNPESPEVFIPDDNIVVNQESQSQENMEQANPITQKEVLEGDIIMSENDDSVKVGQVQDEAMVIEQAVLNVSAPVVNTSQVEDVMVTEAELSGKKDESKQVPVKGAGKICPDRRRSERLKKDTASTTMERVDKMASKRNLEGLQKENDREILAAGADTMLKIAVRLLLKSNQSGAGGGMLTDGESKDGKEAD